MKVPAKYRDFILNYNETFKYLEKEYSRKQVDDYWEYLSRNFLKKLDKLVKEKGISGMYEYWNYNLDREEAPYKLEIDEKRNMFVKTMTDWKKCPPIKVMIDNNIEPYRDYCMHCPGVYGPLLQDYGFNFKVKRNKECRVEITRENN